MKIGKIKMKFLVLLPILLILSVPVYSAVITQFHDGAVRKVFIFQDDYMSDHFYLTLPRSDEVTRATVKITGAPLPSEEPIPADIVLITDVSGSMNQKFNGEGGGIVRSCDNPDIFNDNTQRLQLAKCVNYEFIDTIFSRSLESRIGLVKYSSTAMQDMIYSQGITGLKNVIGRYSAGGCTCISCALKEAINMASTNGNPDHKQVIILMTDGQANTATFSRSCAYNEFLDNPAKKEARDLADFAASMGITVYTIAYGPVGENPLRYIAEVTGGTYNIATNPAEVRAIYDAIAKMITAEDYPQPNIDTNSWSMTTSLIGSAVWLNEDCGSPSATCTNFVNLLNDALSMVDPALCTEIECTIPFALNTNKEGMITLSDILILTEPTTEPPVIVIPDWPVTPQGCSIFNMVVNSYLELPLSSYVGIPFEYQSWSNTPANPDYFWVDIDANNVATVTSPDNPQREDINFTVTDTRTGLSDTVCFSFNSHLELFGLGEEEETRLLVTSSKFIHNWYESPLTGTARYWGPYIATIKVWQKK